MGSTRPGDESRLQTRATDRRPRTACSWTAGERMDGTSTLNEPLLAPGLKGFPHRHRPVAQRDIASLGWHVLADDLPFPVALLKRSALEHNIAWMQRFARERGIDLAPHGK